MWLTSKNNRSLSIRLKSTQNGVVLLVMLTILILGSSYLLVSKLNVSSLVGHQNQFTAKRLNDIQAALLGYAVSNGRLPCPDTDNDGRENGPTCNTVEGNVPWLDLGIAYTDAWGNIIRYRADDNFTAISTVSPNSLSDIRIQTLNGILLSQANPNAPVAMIFSCGVDGIPNNANDANGVTNNNSICSNPGNANNIYIKDTVQINFDDLLLFIPKSLLQQRMTVAGNWP